MVVRMCTNLRLTRVHEHLQPIVTQTLDLERRCGLHVPFETLRGAVLVQLSQRILRHTCEVLRAPGGPHGHHHLVAWIGQA